MRTFGAFLFLSVLALALTACCSDGASNPSQTASACAPYAEAYEVEMIDEPANACVTAEASVCATEGACGACAVQAAAPMRLSMASVDPCTRAALAQGGRLMAVRGRVGAAEYGKAALSLPPAVLACGATVIAEGVIVLKNGVLCLVKAIGDLINPQPSFSIVLVPGPAVAQVRKVKRSACAPAATKSACAPAAVKKAEPCAEPQTIAIPAPTPNAK